MSFLLNIDVPDVTAATTFYTEAFGLTVGRRFGTDFVELKGWPAPVYLLAKQAGTVGAGGDRRRYERHWTPVHIDIVDDDIDMHRRPVPLIAAAIPACADRAGLLGQEIDRRRPSQ